MKHPGPFEIEKYMPIWIIIPIVIGIIAAIIIPDLLKAAPALAKIVLILLVVILIGIVITLIVIVIRLLRGVK